MSVNPDNTGSFDPSRVQRFRFIRSELDATTGVAQLVYAFDDGPELIETLVFPGAPFELDDARAAAVKRALRLLHWIAGVSYYKAAVPPEILIEDGDIDADSTALLTSIYENGLGEFAYRNGIALRGKIAFPNLPRAPSPQPLSQKETGSTGTTSVASLPSTSGRGAGGEGAPVLGLDAGALVAIGGGKDSLVSIETLRDAGLRQTVTWIGGSQLIRACAEHTGLPTLNIERKLAPELFVMNRDGALNGHIPVTAINSAILVLAALLTGHQQVVFSNERSASYGSEIIADDGSGTHEVNHQWSKGWDFERDFGDYVERHIAADLHYYSLLRPLSELAVARRFARLDAYDAVFSSCNRNFHILGERPANRWCGQCPKCRFVFLALAPFMPKPRLLAIFGRNLLDESAQTGGFDALLEFHDHKPFECVGEGIESRAAMVALTERAEWREDALVRRFADDVLPQLDRRVLDLGAQLQPRGEHRLSDAIMERLGEDFRA